MYILYIESMKTIKFWNLYKFENLGGSGECESKCGNLNSRSQQPIKLGVEGKARVL